MPGSLHHHLSTLGSPPGMADAMHLKPNWSILGVARQTIVICDYECYTG